jgi:hypothetical protein
MPRGLVRGRERLGIPFLLLSVKDLARRLPETPGAICWVSAHDYRFLTMPVSPPE